MAGRDDLVCGLHAEGLGGGDAGEDGVVHELELDEVLLEVGVVELDRVEDELESFCTLDCC